VKASATTQLIISLVENDIQSWEWEHEPFRSNCLWQSNIGNEGNSIHIQLGYMRSDPIPTIFYLPFTYWTMLLRMPMIIKNQLLEHRRKTSKQTIEINTKKIKNIRNLPEKRQKTFLGSTSYAQKTSINYFWSKMSRTRRYKFQRRIAILSVHPENY
jgi:hypothetical protein